MALGPYSLAKLYAGASTSPSAARSQGSSYAVASTGIVEEMERRRRQRLQAAIAAGKINKQQLGPNDSALLGLGATPIKKEGGGGGGIFGKIAGAPFKFIGNLGYDIGQAALYLAPSIYNVGKSAVQDVWERSGLGGQPEGDSHFQKNVIDPVLKQYRETYGHGPGHFLGQFGAHPLGPILDAATVVSLGGSAAARAGSATVARAAPGSTLAELGERGMGMVSREGRAPFVHPVTGVELPREFTPRPVAKAGQRVLDAFMKTGPEENFLGKILREHQQRGDVRFIDSMVRAGAWDEATAAMQGLEPIAKLTPDEATALTLLQKGINTPSKITAFQKMVHDTSLDDPEALRALTNGTGVSEDYVRMLGTLPDAVKEKIFNPNDRMIEAHQVWKERVRQQQEELGYSPEDVQKHLDTENERLAPYLDNGRGQVSAADLIERDHGVIHEPDPRNFSSTEDFEEALSEHPYLSHQHGLDEADRIDELQSEGIFDAGKPGIHHVRSGYNLDDEMGGRYDEHWFVYRDEKGFPVGAAALHDRHGIGPEFTSYVFNEEGFGTPRPIGVIREELAKKAASWINARHSPTPHHGIEHVYVPSEEAAGFHRVSSEQWHGIPVGRIATRFGREDRFRRGPTDRAQEAVTRGARYDQTVFAPRKPSHQFHSTGDTFAAGTFRTDARLYLDHVAKRARENAEQVWKKGEFQRIAAKDENGEVLRFKNQREVDERFGKGKMVFVNDDMPLIYFRKEQNLAEDLTNTIDNYIEGLGDDTVINPMNHPDLESMLNQMVETDADAFIKAHWGAIKRPGGAVPREEFEYRMRMASLDQPFRSPVARFLVRMMHRWRTAVLTLMPRWGLNTALGSMILNGIRGVGFRDYWVAQRLQKAGFLPEEFGGGKVLPTGANLGHQMTQEMLEAAAPGYGQSVVANFMSDLGIRFPTRALAQGVQNIENYFRRAAFIHNLRREQRLGRDREGRVIDLGDDGMDDALVGVGQSLDEFYTDILGPKWGGRIGEALQNPQFIERALKETDKTMYNYSILGPFERRVVRQFIPFWGWYKFISMAAYRLPVELPGRMNLVRMLSQIAAEQEAENGPLPEWLKGSILLGEGGPEGKMRYLSTFGANPFAQIVNPMGPKGPVQGLLTLGQLNPGVQAGLLGLGIDPLTGDRVSISPESGVGEDWAGNLWNVNTGREISAAQVGAPQRVLMGILRSLPEYRLAERAVAGPQFPESVPFISPRPMGKATPPTTGSFLTDLAWQATGTAPKSYDLKAYQSARPKRKRYAEKQNQSARRRLRRKISGE